MRPTTRRLTARLTSVALAVAVLFTAAACADVHRAAGPAAWQSLLDGWRTRGDVPAAVLGVRGPGGSPWTGASGTTQRGGGVPTPTDAPFRIASITKVFVAVVVLQLVEEGRLALDHPLSRYLPGLVEQQVTIRQLLDHTSGLPDYAQVPGLGTQLLEDRDRRWAPADVLALVQGDDANFAPGADYLYSNTDYVVLGEVIGAVTDSSWAQEVRRRVLDPLGLHGTFVAGVEAVPTPVLSGYADTDEDGDEEDVETGGPWPALETSEGAAGAMVSTVGDLLTFGDALFHGRLLRDTTLRSMVSGTPFHPRTSNYGLGLEILRPDYRTTVWGHGGFLPGFRSALWYVPSRDAVIVVLADDSRANPGDLAELVMRGLPTVPSGA